MRTIARTLLAFAVIACAAPPPLEAQDTTPATVELTPPDSVTIADTTVSAVVDSTANDTTAIVWPEHFTIKNFLLGNQAVLVLLITSLVLFAGARIFPAFAEANDNLTRLIQGVVAAAISWLVMQWGGTPDATLGALVTGALTVAVGGTVFRMGRTQPGNGSAPRKQTR